MPEQRLRGGIKLRRSHKDENYYKARFVRTARNKIRRLTRRLAFDPTAQSAITSLKGLFGV